MTLLSIAIFAFATMFPTDLSVTPCACLSRGDDDSMLLPSVWQYSRNSADRFPAFISTLIFRSMTEQFGFQSGRAKKRLDILTVRTETSLDLVKTG